MKTRSAASSGSVHRPAVERVEKKKDTRVKVTKKETKVTKKKATKTKVVPSRSRTPVVATMFYQRTTVGDSNMPSLAVKVEEVEGDRGNAIGRQKASLDSSSSRAREGKSVSQKVTLASDRSVSPASTSHANGRVNDMAASVSVEEPGWWDPDRYKNCIYVRNETGQKLVVSYHSMDTQVYQQFKASLGGSVNPPAAAVNAALEAVKERWHTDVMSTLEVSANKKKDTAFQVGGKEADWAYVSIWKKGSEEYCCNDMVCRKGTRIIVSDD